MNILGFHTTFPSSFKAAWIACGFLLVHLEPLIAKEMDAWETQALLDLCGKYVATCPADSPLKLPEDLLEKVAVSLGTRIAAEGISKVETQDIATLALLLARLRTADSGKSRVQPPQPSKPSPSLAPAAAGRSQHPTDKAFADVQKGQEGFAQGVERLGERAVSDRMVITGDITAGVQAATVSHLPDLTSTFGRVRVNFVTRAVPGSRDGRFSEGYFFVQMRAAGGPFDATPVGGARLFSPLNNVATDRSTFNEGTSRGNIYLAKAFLEQEMRLSGGNLTGRIGIINLSDFFDTSEFANNEARQFISTAFVNSAGYKTGISAPGFMGEFRRRVDRDWLGGIVLRGGYAVSRTERAFTSPVSSAEVELQTRFRGLAGKYRLGGTVGNVADVGGLSGIHLGFDQWVSQSFGVYGRYARSNSGPGSFSLGPVKQSYSGGVQWRFVQEGDRVSAWALGFSQAFGIDRGDPLSSERTLETYYRWQLSQNFSISPDLQLVLGAGGKKIRGTHVVGGMRMTFAF